MSIKNTSGDTALISAAKRGHLSCLECIVSQCADVNSKDRDGNGMVFQQ